MKKADLLVICTILLVSGLLFGLKYLPASAGDKILRVELDGQLINEVAFISEEEQQFVVEMPSGQATVEISGGRVRVLPMPKHVCPLGICSSIGWVEQAGDAIVCLPNRLILTVVGGPVNEVWDSLDGITR